MRHKDTELMKNIKDYIIRFYMTHNRQPSTTEIGRVFKIARSTAQNYLVAMDREGMIFYKSGKLKVE